MWRALKWLGTGLLFVLAGLAFTAALLPPLLDRHYYDGPVSDHYDGERFFNPGERGETKRGFLSSRMARFFSGSGRAQWPKRVPVTQVRPYVAGTICWPPRRAMMPNSWRCVDQVDPNLMVATWIGHATVLVQAGGVNILTDPIFSERASPFSWIGPKRVRAPGIRLADLPKIDLIVVSHNHYDHMDPPTLKALWERDRPTIVTSLGNNAIFERAGIPARAFPHLGPSCGRCPGVESLDWGNPTWGEGVNGPSTGFEVTALRNHHWSSRWGADRNRALWSAFRIKTTAGAIFFAGDTGYGDGSWAREAAAAGPVRLAILPIGAYEPRDVMKDNHVNPAEAVRIFDALKPAMALGVHWGTFQLTFEAIDAPVRALARVRGGRRFVVSEVGRPVVVPER